MNYIKINYKIRSIIDISLNVERKTISEIAKILNISRQSISNEIKINSDYWGYNSEYAEVKHRNREKWKNHFKFINKMNSYKHYSKEFKNKYNKKTFSVELTHLYIKNNFNFKIPSIKTVYNWINSNLWVIKRKNILRKQYTKGGKRDGGPAYKRLVGARWVRPFWTRPREINERSTFGHWEIDLIVGKQKAGHSHILSFVERYSRYGILVKVDSKNPWYIALILFELIKIYNLNVKSITSDNGFEFNSLFIIGYKLKIFIYKADPYASQQRGTNENFNGYVRRFFKKKTDFNLISNNEILKVQREINNIPRKIHGYLSASEMYALCEIKEPGLNIPLNEKLYSWQNKKRESNGSRNKFWKTKK
ncbi:transposase [Mycoplasmopsis maculosa]|uniref:Transposase n=1 Tax=Mycoplasmopsis maculosa TaxID=114885 RepID=A0A449B5E4_9BACT|nr:IS30 family transposase [Mycoplasmopsis maculosa]VEU75690.1 transposase [Mycoplasmopsis maculosa]VEU75796.1 transposase [Mycoplasmopsis maculosa]